MQGAETASNLQLLDITQPEVYQVQPAATRQVLDYMHHLTRHRMDVARHLVDLEVPQLEQLVHQIAGLTVNIWCCEACLDTAGVLCCACLCPGVWMAGL